MSRKMLGIFVAITAALLVVGIAWASGDSASGTSSTSTEASSTSAPGGTGSSSTVSDSSSSTDANGSTVTSSGGGTVTTVDGGSSSSTTVDDDNTSTTIDDDNTSTTIDDDGGLVDGTTSYFVGAAGTVTIEVRDGKLILVGVEANTGWSYEVTKNLPDAIDVHFDKGESEAEIEVDIEDGKLTVVIT